jgi:hypothetical protein
LISTKQGISDAQYDLDRCDRHSLDKRLRRPVSGA